MKSSVEADYLQHVGRSQGSFTISEEQVIPGQKTKIIVTMKMTGFLSNLMRSMYEKKYPSDGRVAKVSRRELQIDGPVDLEVFLSGMRRQEYERQNKIFEQRRKRGEQVQCRLCFHCQSLIYRNQLAVAPDSVPFFPYHMLLRYVIPKRIDTDFKDCGPNLKQGLVKKHHFDCRPEFTFEDIVIMAYLVQDAKDYMITQSMGGSGASIPEHIHAHAFLKTQTDFPLLNKACFTLLHGTDNVWINRHITYGILVKGSPEIIARVFDKLRASFHLPSNHYIKIDDDFGGLIGLYIPRVEHLPKTPLRFKKVDWKFGAFEVLGLYDAKNEEIYNSMTPEEACAATCSVTLHDPKQQAEMEEKVRRILL